MAKKKKNKLEETEVYADKAIENKVDAMMSVEEEIVPESPKEQTPSTAPLLDDEPTKKPAKIAKEELPPEQEAKAEEESPEPELEVIEDEKEQTPEEEEPNLDQTIEDLQAKIEQTDKNEPVEISEPIDPTTTESSEVISESDAIDDIVAQESDNIMNVEDAQREALNQPVKDSKLSKFKKACLSIFTNPKRRKILIGVIFLCVLFSLAVPASRYFLLNTVGVRSSSSVKVVDEKTLQPLKNVEVTIGKINVKTDKEGKANLKNIKLGSQEMTVKKPAFADIKKTLVIGWGSNPLGELKLNPVGSHYNFNIKHYLSGQPIKEVEVETEDGEATAVANEKGEASLVVEDTKQSEIYVKIRASKFREEKLTLDRNDKQARDIAMVPDHKHAFVSKRSGKYDLYSIYVDGKDEQKILAGTGYEKPEGLMISPALESSNIAFVTTRDNNRNKDGFLLSSLYIIDANENKNKVITRSERIQIIGWFGPRLVYVKATEGTSAENPARHKLISYNAQSGEEKELASANYFNDVLSASGSIYYAPTSFKLAGSIGLFRVNPDGTNKQTIINQEAWNILRQTYDNLSISVGQQWYDYGLDNSKLTKLAGPPASNDSKVIVDNTENQSVLVDQRDGKGVLILYDKGTKKDKQLEVQPGLANPIYWLSNDTVVFRIVNNNEIADYAISKDGGEKKKIANVTNTAGIDRWYYY